MPSQQQLLDAFNHALEQFGFINVSLGIPTSSDESDKDDFVQCMHRYLDKLYKEGEI